MINRSSAQFMDSMHKACRSMVDSSQKEFHHTCLYVRHWLSMMDTVSNRNFREGARYDSRY